ncbi:hypothetical protein WMY93_033709 [Mugilogobius chulae]|uniref:Uncharacterized protein n=1 Tax=Mugilogobius chulae TaxID=88201 RepID=A0AAW0MK86_9GOBI
MWRELRLGRGEALCGRGQRLYTRGQSRRVRGKTDSARGQAPCVRRQTDRPREQTCPASLPRTDQFSAQTDRASLSAEPPSPRTDPAPPSPRTDPAPPSPGQTLPPLDRPCPSLPLPGPLRCLLAESVDDAEGLCVAVERCPLCGTSRRRLTCARCVQTGDFVHLSSRGTERYSEKVERLKKLREEKDLLQRRVLEALDKKLHADEKKWKVMSAKGKVQQLKEAVALGNDKLKNDLELLFALRRRCCVSSAEPARHQEKRDKIERHTNKSPRPRADQPHLQPRRTNTHPGRKTLPTREEDSADTVSELAEARRTTYLSGRWNLGRSERRLSISITCQSVHLPSNGDWLRLLQPSSAPRQQAPPQRPRARAGASEPGSHHQRCSVLHHPTVHHPVPHPGHQPAKKLCHSEFCGETLSRYRFTRALNKLNTNVLHLCFSQLVDSEKLHPHHTLRNLMFLVSPANSHLGRTGPFEVYGGLEESMEFLEPEGGPLEESGEETVTDEETDLGTDWETVPSPRFCDIPSQDVVKVQKLQEERQ